MTRRALFARLAGLLGVPYVAKAMPAAVKPGDVFTMASVNVVNWPPRYETWYARVEDGHVFYSRAKFHRDAYVMEWPKAATRGTGLSDIFKGEPLTVVVQSGSKVGK